MTIDFWLGKGSNDPPERMFNREKIIEHGRWGRGVKCYILMFLKFLLICIVASTNPSHFEHMLAFSDCI